MTTDAEVFEELHIRKSLWEKVYEKKPISTTAKKTGTTEEILTKG
jgi:hypothetical protein